MQILPKKRQRLLVIIPAVMLLLAISANAEWTTNLTEYIDLSEGGNGLLNHCNLTSGNATKISNGYLFNSTKKNYLEYDCKLNNQTTIMIWYNNTKGYPNLMNSKWAGTEKNGDFSIGGNISLSRYYSGNNQDNTGNAYNGNYNKYTLAIAEHTTGKKYLLLQHLLVWCLVDTMIVVKSLLSLKANNTISLKTTH